MNQYTNQILRYIYILFRLAFVVFIIFLIGLCLYYAGKLAYPFLIALVISFLLNPIVDTFEKKAKMPRGLAAFFAIILIFGLIFGLIFLIVFQMINGLTYLTAIVPSHVEKLIEYIQAYFFSQILPLWKHITHLFNHLNAVHQQAIQNNIKDMGEKAGNSLAELGTSLISWLSSFIISLPNILTASVFILLATFFITKDWHKNAYFLKSKLTPKVTSCLKLVYDDLRKAFFGFFRAQLTLIAITGMIVLMGLFIMKIDHAFTIGMISAGVDLLPYLGIGFIFFPWIIYEFFTGHYYLTIGLSILFSSVIIGRQILEPKILSSSIGLDPLLTLIAMFIAFKLFGFLGLILGPVSLVVSKSLVQANVIHDIWSFIIGNDSTET
ncbi:sporulation integral membrane protein YtvI [Scopulibacillus daqui]|uniref:Sporulation integral membrane protein YtvI n=1 Tax=Scopulibacillus daqui TaxID=1469162 RepID=A0ABS2PXL8_9BACL|nr:sporulation integral membrane protein YtvI [Scopulibacillus daqui]MBM7644793.1 sporulation integral membrane protein YtvI [Scopulibacillus daqui]